MTLPFRADSLLRKQAIQHLGVHFLHKAHLATLFDRADDEARGILHRLWNCWPYGALVGWRGQGKKTRRNICRMPRQCIFCHARLVRELYRRLETGRQVRNANFLILGRLEVTDEMVRTDGDPAQDMRWIKSRLTKLLVKRAKAFGASGGLTTFIVGPAAFDRWVDHEVRPGDWEGFTYSASIVATIDRPTKQFYDLLDDPVPEFNLGDDSCFTESANVVPKWSIRLGSETDTLRFLLAGTSFLRHNIVEIKSEPGAFVLPPWPLATFAQWWQHYLGTKNLHLYDLWGEWKGATPRQATHSAAGVLLTNASTRRGAYNRRLAFQSANTARSRQALERREALLQVLLSDENRLQRENRNRVGRERLMDFLRDAGHTISQRDARYLAARLNQPDELLELMGNIV